MLRVIINVTLLFLATLAAGDSTLRDDVAEFTDILRRNLTDMVALLVMLLRPNC